MSRTIRRKSGKAPTWRDDLAWRYHTDAINWHGSVKASVKDHTDTERRADERAMLHNLKNDPEFDAYDLEKHYLGIIWCYD